MKKEIYLTYSTRNAHLLEEEYDIITHDPQPLAMPHLRGRGETRWVWRCHIDTSEPNPELWGFLRPYLDDYDAAVFTLEDFVLPEFPVSRVEVIPPAIDPESPKNVLLPDYKRRGTQGSRDANRKRYPASRFGESLEGKR